MAPRKHRVRLNNTIKFDVLINGERKAKQWHKGKVFTAAIRSRSEEKTIDGEKCGVEVADVVIFKGTSPAVVLSSLPCEFFSFIEDDDE